MRHGAQSSRCLEPHLPREMCRCRALSRGLGLGLGSLAQSPSLEMVSPYLSLLQQEARSRLASRPLGCASWTLRGSLPWPTSRAKRLRGQEDSTRGFHRTGSLRWTTTRPLRRRKSRQQALLLLQPRRRQLHRRSTFSAPGEAVRVKLLLLQANAPGLNGILQGWHTGAGTESRQGGETTGRCRGL